MSRRPLAFLAAAALVTACSPAEAPQPAAAIPDLSVMTDLMKDVSEVEQKMVDLAKAIPAAKYTYRPSAGVRSVGEVVMHVASDNYFIPAAAGTPAPEATGIKPDSYESVVAYEKRQVPPDSAVAHMAASFAFLKDAMKAQSAASLGEKKNMFGSEFTGQQVWIMATTHLHEHLGQMIAYARANGVVPPWSK